MTVRNYNVHTMNTLSFEKEEVLDILNKIEKEPYITQRTLSKDLGISLGKVNFLLTSLTQHGLIKVKRFKNSKNKIAYLYLLTPDGIKNKTKITRKFLEKKIEEYNHLRQEIERLRKEAGEPHAEF